MSKRIHGPTILLVSGEYFHFLEPETSRFTILDIAHALSNICRFTGQSDRFYSVAEHSVHCSRHVAPDHAMAALMHDAAEAFIGDVSRPLKAMLPEYKIIEHRIERAIFDRFSIKYPFDPEINQVDNRLLVTEKCQLMNNSDERSDLRGFYPVEIELPCWAPEVAKSHFLVRYEELTDRSILVGNSS
jgi:uncharacterized protein